MAIKNCITEYSCKKHRVNTVDICSTTVLILCHSIAITKSCELKFKIGSFKN